MPNPGIIMPDMGKPMINRMSEAAAIYAAASLSDALFTTTQQRVLGSLFGQPQRSFTVSELIHGTGAGSGAVQRELARLSGSGLLTVEKVGNQKHYRANPDAPIHAELVGIVRKTFGLAEPLRRALAPLADKLRAAFVFGSMASGAARAGSDIDLLLIGEGIRFGEVAGLLHPMQETLGREINPKLYTPVEWRKLAKANGAFFRDIMSKPKLFLVGGEDELG